MEIENTVLDSLCSGSTKSYEDLMDIFAYRPDDLSNKEHIIDELNARATSGNAIAQAFLSTLYLNGFGIAVDRKKALALARRSAGLGEPSGEVRLGIMYLYGYEISADSSRALYWFQMARDKNYAPANNFLGYMYERGIGVKEIQKKPLIIILNQQK
jgi:TPR repeat protein